MSKKTFSIVVPAANESNYVVAVEADYFTVDDNGFLRFSTTQDSGSLAAFRDWIYVITK